MSVPIIVPDLKSNETLRVCGWLVEVGEEVQQGDRLVELLTTGITFDVAAPVSGQISAIDKSRNTPVTEGEILGWIATDTDEGV